MKCQLLDSSSDKSIQSLFKSKKQRESKKTRIWKATQLHPTTNAQVELDIHFPAHTGRGGLGLTKLNRNPSPAQRRKLASGILKMMADEERIAHAHSLSRQGVDTMV